MKRAISLLLVLVVALAITPASAQGLKKIREKIPTPEHMPIPGATMPERWLPVDENGWTILKPTSDSRIIYVSSSEGDDATGQVYKPGDEVIGIEPMDPIGMIRPFKSIDAAMAKARDKQPDWVLLRRGDAWEGQGITAMSGRSRTEPSVVASYGTDSNRPTLRGGGSRISLGGRSAIRHAVVTGIDIYRSGMDPDSLDYGKSGSKGGISISSGNDKPIENILVEDCRLRFAAASCTGASLMTNVVFRRNLVLDHYTPKGHTQGLWGSHGSILIEESIFDHNGWLYQNVAENKGKPGLANPLSHNTYCTQMYSTTFRDNLILRAASIGNKFTANYGPGSVKDLVVDNNLYVEGELATGMGGNRSAPLRWVDCRMTNNVMLDIGRSQPTGRNLAWYMGATDWDGGEIAGNLFLHQHSPSVRNVRGLLISGGRDGIERTHTRGLTIRQNLFYGLRSARCAMRFENVDGMENVAIADNLFQFDGIPSTLVDIDGLSPELKFSNNVYDSAADVGQWFGVGETMLSFEQWLKQSGEKGARKEKVNFPDPERCIETYMKSLGEVPSFDAFIAEARKQSKANWRKEFTASVINNWIREGFGVKKIPVSTTP